MQKYLNFLLITIAFWMVASCRWKEANVGLVNGKLKACPPSPNCVCSQVDEKDQEHFINAIELEINSPDQAKSKINEIMKTLPRTKLEKVEGNHLHFTVTTKLMRYVDDVEFLIDVAENKIHVRSASRIGHSDLGVNRKRVDKIKAAFEKQSH